MYTYLHCIALRTVRHSDSRNIVTAWSREAGRVAFAFPAGTGREARRRKAMTSPLAAFEGVCDFRPGRDIQSLRDVRPMPDSLAMNSDPTVGLISIFLSEVLDVLLKRTTADETLSDFLFASLACLAAGLPTRAGANFHIYRLYRLTFLLGIAPDIEGYAPGLVFDMREGRFLATPPLHPDFLDADESRFAAFFDRLSVQTLACLKLSHQERNRILDVIIRYYGIHLVSLSSLRSLSVLRDM